MGTLISGRGHPKPVAVSVLFLAERYLPEWAGGGELSGALVAELVSRMPGFEVRVLTQGDGSVGTVRGVRVERTVRRAPVGLPDDLGRGPLLTARAAPAIARAAKGADVVHSISPRTIPAAVAGARLAGVPATSVMNDNWATCFMCTHVHGGALCGACTPGGLRECLKEHGGNARAAPLLFREFRSRMGSINALAGVVAVAPAIRRALERCGATSPITVIPPPVDIGAFEGTAGSTAEPGLVLFVGRLSTGKGVLEALEAFAAAASGRPKARLEVVGDGSELEAARRRAHELGVEGHVAFLGLVPPEAMPPLYARAQLVLAPFVRVEAFGRVGIEAAAAGRPVLTTDLWGGAELIDVASGAGTIVPWNDREAWAGALGRMLDDPAGCAAMGREARRRVEAIYADGALERAYSAFFEGVLARGA